MPQLKLERVCPEGDIPAMRTNWRGLGEKKWIERIDGDQHKHGKYVFDKGLHNGSVEPGFIVSYDENVVPLIEAHLGLRTTPEFFLALHEASCWHFDGDRTDTLMGTEKVGVFRGTDDHISCTYTLGKDSLMADFQEFLDFVPKLGTLKWVDEDKKQIHMVYKRFTPEEVKQILSAMLDDFYVAILQPGLSQRDKFRACAKLAKEMDWLHPPRDGATRTCLDLLQKHMTEFLGHPVILEDPHMMTKMGLERFTDYLEQGFARWEKERAT